MTYATTITAIAGALGAASSLFNVFNSGGGDSGSPMLASPPPASPATDPNAKAQQEAAAEQERRRRIAGAFGTTNPTGGLGDTSTPSLAAKNLLGG